jgi:hypothetical protein
MSASQHPSDTAQPMDSLAEAMKLVRLLARHDVQPANAAPVIAVIEELVREAISGSPAASGTPHLVQLATVAEAIASDAAVAREHLAEAIGQLTGGCSEGLAGLVVLVGRMGLMADAISRAAGGTVWFRDPLGWVLPSDGAAGAVAQLQEGFAA